MNNGNYRNLVNQNFDEITVGYNMKHGAMVNGSGALNFDPVDRLIASLQSAGLSVYGHTLVWHQNQNAAYLNALIAPQVIVEKSDEEKAALIGQAMETWISQMVGHYKNTVKAWDVVNEAMNDAGGLRTGKNVESPASDEFYWQDYLGKDFAVTAFNLARQHGNATDKLFINDYGLENGSLAKLDGLIDYVKYIEEKGAKVDGIGTQLHLSLSSSRENIARMFERLAQTGKLIKVSELDIQVGTASHTAGQYAEQAGLYQYVVEMYVKYIPENQRYGITVWGVTDSADEHAYWLPNDAPCLWDGEYARKHAYKGFADGLAGRDVSADFTGETIY
jgi:GH35 family endo-1,4-beta-xylanase